MNNSKASKLWNLLLNGGSLHVRRRRELIGPSPGLQLTRKKSEKVGDSYAKKSTQFSSGVEEGSFPETDMCER